MRFANTQSIQEEKDTVLGDATAILNRWYSTYMGALIMENTYLAFIELLSSFLGTGPVLTGRHMALQCAIPCKSLMTIWTLVRFFP